jgi:hypothetical protein
MRYTAISLDRSHVMTFEADNDFLAGEMAEEFGEEVKQNVMVYRDDGLLFDVEYTECQDVYFAKWPLDLIAIDAAVLPAPALFQFALSDEMEDRHPHLTLCHIVIDLLDHRKNIDECEPDKVRHDRNDYGIQAAAIWKVRLMPLPPARDAYIGSRAHPHIHPETSLHGTHHVVRQALTSSIEVQTP